MASRFKIKCECISNFWGNISCTDGSNQVVTLESIHDGIISAITITTDIHGNYLEFILTHQSDGSGKMQWITSGLICNVDRGLRLGRGGCI